MNILAIETSCDETSVAIVRDGRQVLANVIASQIGLHERYGGVVPELAARQHIITLVPALEETLRRAQLNWDGVDAVAVTCGPGLAGALLVGLNAAKAIAWARGKPLIAVNHLEAHIYSNWVIPAGLEAPAPAPPTPTVSPAAVPRTRGAGAALRALGVEPAGPAGPADLPARPPSGRPQFTPPPPAPMTPQPDLDRAAPTDPAFPLLCLVVSGGHTELVYMSGHGQYSLLGKTVDDAAGEAFDKVARILGLPYPGGPAIQQAAAHGNPDAIDLPRAVLRGSYDFSFSGLKTAALRQAQNYGPPIQPEEEAAARAAAAEARRAEEARREAAEQARRAAEAQARWEEDERARRAVDEERRAAAARRAEEERIRRDEEYAAQERVRLEAARERQAEIDRLAATERARRRDADSPRPAAPP
ncbi:MAG TPA: tRNA (adenosine(37)-N6)-threonylcarbamoyltransferase complex transferase subunit TsaD, partial [Chloroflexia bacterium]|nr:tRNA (adenosine(37)-N6)-threonylcarbamoyltransferase complex transferase subunit TsaD [Chloroflexia bacterium]